MTNTAQQPDEIVYIRTSKGQEWLSENETTPLLDADQRRALLFVNGFTPVCALFGPSTLAAPIEDVLAFLVFEQLITPVDTSQRSRKWFAPAVEALGASLRNSE